MADPSAADPRPQAGPGRLAGRVALVTGASRGIGAAVARRFAAEGAHVVLVARTVGGLEEVDDSVRASGGAATLVPLDLAQGEAIDRLGQALWERFKRLDVLVGNAAVLGALSPLGHVEPAAWDRAIALNLTANWRLIRAMDPLLRRSEQGRAIFVTAEAARRAVPFWGAYAVSKAALEMLAGIYAGETAETSVRVNLVDPGPTRTALRRQAFPGEAPDSLAAPDSRTEAFVRLAEASCTLHGQTVSA